MFIYFLLVFLLILSIYFYLSKKRLEKKIKLRARIISGKTIEKLLPFFENFKYHPHDMRWIGEPIDYIIFDGYSHNNPKQIVFLEVKTGKSKLNEMQRKLKELVRKKKIKWEEVRI